MDNADRQLIDPVHDDAIPKVDNAVAVGEDLKFQERWWIFEYVVWSVFVLALIADAVGIFGRGWLAHAALKTPGSGMEVKYERVDRTGTPSRLSIAFDQDAVANGQVQLLASDSMIKGLGAMRIIPAPEHSVVGQDGILYTFPATGGTAQVEFELQPPAPGNQHWKLQVPGKQAVEANVFVVP